MNPDYYDAKCYVCAFPIHPHGLIYPWLLSLASSKSLKNNQEQGNKVIQPGKNKQVKTSAFLEATLW